MKGKWLLLSLAALLVAAYVPLSLAQAPTPAIGDLGSVASGMWDTVSTWKVYSSHGAFDSTATAAPSSSINAFVLTGTTVTYQTSSNNVKSLVIQSGGKLQTAATLPTAVVVLKINGPTVWVDGAFGKDSTDALSIETKYNGTITLGGSGVVNIAQLRPNSSQSGTLTFVFATNAKINYTGTAGGSGAGIYTSRGTQTSSTFTINPGVTVNFAPGSHFELNSSTTALGTMNTTLNVNGTMNLPASSLILADDSAHAAQMNIGATGVVNVGLKLSTYLAGGSVGAITVASGGVLNVLSGGTADFTNPSATITGAGTFALKPGATINVGALAGLDPANGPVRTAVATFDTAATYAYTGTGLQVWGPQLPDSIRGLTIGSKSIDSTTAADPKKVTGVLQIDGLLVDNGGGLTSAGSAIVNGTYQMNNTTGPIPVATWNTGSNCLVTGLVTISSAGIPNGNQNFYNYTVDCPKLNGPQRLGFDTDTLRGNLTIHNTNDVTTDATNYIALCPKTTNSNVTLLGNLIIDSTTAAFSVGTGSGVVVQTLTVKGNIISKGSFYLNGSGCTNRVFVSGDVIIQSATNTSFRGHSAVAYADSVNFSGTGVQHFTKPVALTSLQNIRLLVLPGSTLVLDDTTFLPFTGTLGGFTADSGATVKFGNPGGIDSTIRGFAPVLDGNTTYEFNSKSSQVTGRLFPAAVRNLTVNDSLGVMLSDTLKVTGTLALTKGTLAATDSSTLTIDSTGSVTRTDGYVVGRMTEMFAAPGTKNFPVGTANGYSPVRFKINTGKGAVTVGVRQIEHPQTFDSLKTAARYWTLTPDSTVKNADISFTYLPVDALGHGRDSLYGAWRYTGSGKTWTAIASVHPKGSKTVSVAGVTSFSDWTLGESSLVTSIGTSNEPGIPSQFFVNQNYPNPFNPTTTISYGLPGAAYVTVTVYSMLGQEITILQAGEQKAGVHTLRFDGSRLASGVYFYRVSAGQSTAVKHMLLVK